MPNARVDASSVHPDEDVVIAGGWPIDIGVLQDI
jgi:hypothetical protein